MSAGVSSSLVCLEEPLMGSLTSETTSEIKVDDDMVLTLLEPGTVSLHAGRKYL